MLEKVGAAKIIKNDELGADNLHKQITDMLNKNMLEKMGENAKKIKIENSQDKIYKEIKDVLKG